MTVDPQLLSWAQLRLDGTLRVVPHQIRGLSYVPLASSAVAAVCWLLLFASAILDARAGTAGTGLQLLAHVGGLLLLGGVTLGVGTRWWPYAGAVGAVATLTGWFGWYSPSLWHACGWAVALTGSLVAVGVRLARPWLSPADLDAYVPEESVPTFNSYGTPGTPGHVDNADTRAAARMGDDALLPLTWFPATRTFHGPVFDPSGAATSHVVVCGNRVAVIDTILWTPGTYQFSPHGAVTCAGTHFVYGATPVAVAVAAWSAALPSAVEVRGWVMVGSPYGPVSTVPEGPGPVRLGTPQQVLEEVGAWFAAGDPYLVDRRIVLTVATGLRGRTP